MKTETARVLRCVRDAAAVVRGSIVNAARPSARAAGTSERRAMLPGALLCNT
jgi:hypothetical protein